MPIKTPDGTNYTCHGTALEIDESYQLEPTNDEKFNGIVSVWVYVATCLLDECKRQKYFREDVTRMGAQGIRQVKKRIELTTLKARLTEGGYDQSHRHGKTQGSLCYFPFTFGDRQVR